MLLRVIPDSIRTDRVRFIDTAGKINLLHQEPVLAFLVHRIAIGVDSLEEIQFSKAHRFAVCSLNSLRLKQLLCGCIRAVVGFYMFQLEFEFFVRITIGKGLMNRDFRFSFRLVGVQEIDSIDIKSSSVIIVCVCNKFIVSLCSGVFLCYSYLNLVFARIIFPSGFRIDFLFFDYIIEIFVVKVTHFCTRVGNRVKLIVFGCNARDITFGCCLYRSSFVADGIGIICRVQVECKYLISPCHTRYALFTAKGDGGGIEIIGIDKLNDRVALSDNTLCQIAVGTDLGIVGILCDFCNAVFGILRQTGNGDNLVSCQCYRSDSVREFNRSSCFIIAFFYG